MTVLAVFMVLAVIVVLAVIGARTPSPSRKGEALKRKNPRPCGSRKGGARYVQEGATARQAVTMSLIAAKDSAWRTAMSHSEWATSFTFPFAASVTSSTIRSMPPH